MLLIPLMYVKEEDILGKSLIDKDHQIIIQKGMRIKLAQIKRLMELGYNNLYVESKIDYEPPELLSSETRDVFVEMMKDIYIKIKKLNELKEKDEKSRNVTAQFKLDDEITGKIEKLAREVEFVVGEIMTNGKDYLDYVTIKNYANYPFHHAIDSGVLAVLIGKRLNMNARQLFDIFIASILSELSNASMPEKVIYKRGKLTDEEFDIVKKHPENAYAIAKACPFLSHHVKLICLEHHEKYDGTGYPNHLKSTEIDISARILSVCEAFDSLTSSRTYRPPYAPHKALNIIMGESGKAFDVELAKALSEVIVPYPIGTIVKLNTDEKAVVVGIHRDAPERPVLVTLGGSRQRKIDMKVTPELSITALKYDR